MFKLAIIGSSPSGLSTAAHAAALGVPHVLLESKDLAHGHACVSTCPTGAALRVSPERFRDYTNAVEA
jgi:flavin-dependent dehydrogenase